MIMSDNIHLMAGVNFKCSWRNCLDRYFCWWAISPYYNLGIVTKENYFELLYCTITPQLENDSNFERFLVLQEKLILFDVGTPKNYGTVVRTLKNICMMNGPVEEEQLNDPVP